MNLSTSKNHDQLYLLLCFLTLMVPFIGSAYVFQTASIVAIIQIVFICAFIFLPGPSIALSSPFRTFPRASFLLGVFIVSVSISFFTSPYDVIYQDLGRRRFVETLTHIAFFCVVFQFLWNRPSNAEGEDKLLIRVIAFSGPVLTLVFLLIWQIAPPVSEEQWWNKPPLATHMRHIGHLLTASVSTSVILVLYPGIAGKLRVLYSITTLLTLTFLFWTGGRAAALSVLIAIALTVIVLLYHKELKAKYLASCSFLVFASLYLSQMLSVYYWNGILTRFAQTAGATNLEQYSTGRLGMWTKVIFELKSDWAFGYGPQGYFYMPGRYEGIYHPHNFVFQSLFEWGAIGTFIFISMLLLAGWYLITWSLMPRKLPSQAFLAAFAALSSLTIHALFSGSYFFGQPSYLVALTFAICLSQVFPRKNSG